MVGMEMQTEARPESRCACGREVRRQEVFMEPCMEGPAACVAQKHFKLVTGELCMDWTLQRGSLPATKPKSLNNMESNEEKVWAAHSQEESRLHLASVQSSVILLASGTVQGLMLWKNLACWVQQSYLGWKILLSHLCVVIAAIGTKMCVGFGSSEVGFTRFAWGTLVKTPQLNWRESFFSFPKVLFLGRLQAWKMLRAWELKLKENYKQ